MVKTDIKKKLDEHQTVLLLIPSIDYNHIIVDIAKKLSGKKVCYVTLNKTHKSLEELFNGAKVNTKNLFFVDGISKTLKKTPDSSDNCIYVGSPAALTELSLTLRKLLKDGFDYLIFDSVTTLGIYEKNPVIAKFIASVINKVKETKARAVFYTIGGRDGDELIRECSVFVDEVVESG